MKRLTNLIILLGLVLLVPPCVWGQPFLTAEPPLDQRIDWDLYNNGMLVSRYDLNHNGKADFYTLRLVTASYFSKLSVAEVTESYPRKRVFVVRYDSSNYFYVVNKEPMLYGIDMNEDGRWDWSYKDPFEDGVNGNEIAYEKPSNRNILSGGKKIGCLVNYDPSGTEASGYQPCNLGNK